jgi:alkylation response protein AidB-like acyl-CoA dehydrogenase
MGNVLNLEGVALNPVHGRLRRKIADLGKTLIGPNADEVDRSGRFPEDNLKALGRAGVLGSLMPEELGGLGIGILGTAIVAEEIARHCASTAQIYCMHQCSLPLLVALADDRQKETVLMPIARGEKLCAYANSEPGTGNKLWHMESFARPEKDGFAFNARKSIVTSAGRADLYLVPVRANGQAGPTDLSMFVVEAGNPGIHAGAGMEPMGMRGSHSRPMEFRDCRVRAEDRFGPPTAAFSYMMAYSLPPYLVGLSACYVGIAQSALDASLAHVKRRVHTDSGKSLAELDTVQRYIGEMSLRLQQVRAAVHRIARMADAAKLLFDQFGEAGILDSVVRENPDDPLFVDLSNAKVAACEMAVEVCHRALQVCGGAAYIKGNPVERCYRDARAGSLQGPSDDTLKILVGRHLLGLKQPWA